MVKKVVKKKGLESFSQNALKRLAMRAGIIRLSKEVIDEFRFIIQEYISSILLAVDGYLGYSKRKTIMPQDITSAIKHVYGISLYYSIDKK